MSILPAKYKVVRTYPTQKGNNWTTIEQSRKYKVDTLEEFIKYEVEIMKKMLQQMHCDKELTQKSLKYFKLAMESMEIDYQPGSEQSSEISERCDNCQEPLDDEPNPGNYCEICNHYFCDECLGEQENYDFICCINCKDRC